MNGSGCNICLRQDLPCLSDLIESDRIPDIAPTACVRLLVPVQQYINPLNQSWLSDNEIALSDSQNLRD